MACRNGSDSNLLAGITLREANGSKTAVYIGAFSQDYKSMLLRDPEYQGPYTVTGISLNMLANRISWFFNFLGPSIQMDTACSSSLVALHVACQALRNHESETVKQSPNPPKLLVVAHRR